MAVPGGWRLRRGRCCSEATGSGSGSGGSGGLGGWGGAATIRKAAADSPEPVRASDDTKL